MKILSICPSIYPQKLDKMFASFNDTVNCSALIINDEVKPITQIFNETFEKYPDYDYYHMTNDDVIYKTKDWDVLLANAIIEPGIAYGNDMFQSENLCTFPMISGDIVRKLDWLQMPTLNRYCGDVVWKFIGESTKCLHYVPEVIIEHKWDGCSDININNKDLVAFSQWLPWSFKDVAKVREVINESTRRL